MFTLKGPRTSPLCSRQARWRRASPQPLGPRPDPEWGPTSCTPASQNQLCRPLASTQRASQIEAGSDGDTERKMRPGPCTQHPTYRPGEGVTRAWHLSFQSPTRLSAGRRPPSTAAGGGEGARGLQQGRAGTDSMPRSPPRQRAMALSSHL